MTKAEIIKVLSAQSDAMKVTSMRHSHSSFVLQGVATYLARHTTATTLDSLMADALDERVNQSNGVSTRETRWIKQAAARLIMEAS